MDNKDSDILSKIGKDPGFRVPENYFSDFTKNMVEMLPERNLEEEPPVTLWQRIRPWAYMAAMFAGIWCTMYIFSSLSGVQHNFNPAIAEAFDNESFVDDFVLSNDFDEYTLMQELYEDSIFIDSETSELNNTIETVAE